MSSVDIEFVAATPRSLVMDGRTIVVTPIEVRRLPALVRAVDPMLAQLIYGADNLDAVQVVSMIGQHGEAVIEAVAICTGESKEAVGALLLDRLVALALLCVEVNADFFTQALANLKTAAPTLAPVLLQKLLARLPSAPAAAGPTPSTS